MNRTWILVRSCWCPCCWHWCRTTNNPTNPPCQRLLSMPTVSPPTKPRWRGVGPAAVTLAEAEGLQAHARSIAMRLGNSIRRADRAP